MRYPNRPILGINITQTEVQVAEVGGPWDSPQVRHAGAFPTPPGTAVGGLPGQPQALGDALRAYLAENKITTREAVFGVSPDALLTRTLDVPAVPDGELRAVIEGEMAYQKLVREDAALFDFARLGTADLAAQTGPQALVMAAEEGAVAGYAAVAARAGLRLLAAEPVLVAMLRAAYRQVQDRPAALCVAVAGGAVELSIVDGGVLRLYRRADIAHVDLVAPGPPQPESAPSPFPFPPEPSPGAPSTAPRWVVPRMAPLNLGVPGAVVADESPAAAEADRHLNPHAAHILALELGRSLEYYYREFPQSLAVGSGVLACDDPVLAPLAGWLSQALSLDFALAAPPDSAGALAAVGLALHDAPDAPAALPRFDLSTRQRALGALATARRNLTLALAVSIAVVLVAIGVAYAFGLRANRVDHELYHETEALESIQHAQRQMLTDLETQRIQLQALRKQGVPFPRLMDSLAAAVAPGAGLTDVSLDAYGRLQIGGEAAGGTAMTATLDRVGASPLLRDTRLESFDDTAGAGHLVTFQISSRLAGAPAPPATAP